MRILVRVALSLLEWAVLFVPHFVGIGCYLMVGGCAVIAAAGERMGLVTVEETVRTLEIGFGFFGFPLVGEQAVAMIDTIMEWISICVYTHIRQRRYAL